MTNKQVPDFTQEGGMFKGTLKTSSDEETVIQAQADDWKRVDEEAAAAAAAAVTGGGA